MSELALAARIALVGNPNSGASQIALRMLAYGEKPADEALIRRRIESAIAFRESLAITTLAKPVNGEMRRRGEGGAREDRDDGFAVMHCWKGNREQGTL